MAIDEATKLGKLKKVELREYWKHEALDFTKWLSESENLDELGDEIGIDIELIQTEASVGRFSADILAQEETTGRKIVIENQLESTDHSHLGQILTYAAGIEAEYIVWIVKDVKEEHKQAVEWLNEHTDEKINFFLLKIELWQIDNSKPAPKFMVMSRPNGWTKSIRGSVHEQGQLTERKLKLLEFWQLLKEYASSNSPSLKLRTPRAQHWYDISIGRSDSRIALTALTRENQIGCELYIPDSKGLYKALYEHKKQIEAQLNISDLVWQELPEKKASRIQVSQKFDFAGGDKQQAFLWMLEMVSKFKAVFSKNWEISNGS